MRGVDGDEVANVGPPRVAASEAGLTVSILSTDSNDEKGGGLGRISLNAPIDVVAELAMVERVVGEGESKVVESIGSGWNFEKLGVKGGPKSGLSGPLPGGAGTEKGPAM